MTSTISKSNARTLRTLLEENALRYGTLPAVVGKQGETVSHARLWEEVSALSATLAPRLAPGAHVLLLGKDGYPFLRAFLALTVGGAVPVPAAATLTPEALSALAKAADATAVLYDAGAAAQIAALSGLTAISLEELPQLMAEGHGLDAVPSSLDPESPAVICYTADAAMGVVLSHRCVMALLADAARAQKLTEADRALSVLPLSHPWGLLLGVLLPLSRGGSVAFADGMGSLLATMRAHRPTFLVTLPFLADALLEKYRQTVSKNGLAAEVRRTVALTDPIRPIAAGQSAKHRRLAASRRLFGGALRRMLVVGGPLAPQTQKELWQIGILTAQGYGKMEAAGLMATGGANALHVLPSAELEICSPQPDGSGEVRYRGENLFSGYYNDDAATEAVLREGWLYTGDMGRLDETGHLCLIGRKENALHPNADTVICPEELELLLCESPLVREAAVVTIPGEADASAELVAILGLDAADLDDPEATERLMEEWVRHVNEDLPAYKQLALFTLRAAPLCRNAAGQPDRTALARELQG